MKNSAICLLAFAVLFGCGDYEIPLGQSYELVRLSSNFFCLVDQSDYIVAGPNITHYSNNSRFIFGLVECDLERRAICKREGYFILNKDTGEGVWELTEPEWRLRVVDLGFEKAPPLSEPSRIDSWFH